MRLTYALTGLVHLNTYWTELRESTIKGVCSRSKINSVPYNYRIIPSLEVKTMPSRPKQNLARTQKTSKYMAQSI